VFSRQRWSVLSVSFLFCLAAVLLPRPSTAPVLELRASDTNSHILCLCQQDSAPTCTYTVMFSAGFPNASWTDVMVGFSATGVVTFKDFLSSGFDDGFFMTRKSSSEDSDGDGLSNLQEFGLCTDPMNADTDGDSLPDGWEHQNGISATDNGSTNPDNGENGDPDHDGIPNSAEMQAGSSPRQANSAKSLCSIAPMEFKSVSATRWKCGFTEFVPSQPPVYYTVKTDVREMDSYLYDASWNDVCGCGFTGYLNTAAGQMTIVSSWDVASCVVLEPIYSGWYEAYERVPCIARCTECAVSGSLDADGTHHCVQEVDVGMCMDRHACSSIHPLSAWDHQCPTTVLQSAHLRQEQTFIHDIGYDNYSYDQTLSDPYTRSELIDRAKDDLNECGLAGLNWGESRYVCVAEGDICVEGGSGITSLLGLSDDETTVSMRRVMYRAHFQSESNVVYRLSWIERFTPADGGPVVDDRVVEYVRGTGGMTYSKPHTLEVPWAPGEVAVVSEDYCGVEVVSLEPERGGEIDDGDSDSDTATYALCIDGDWPVNVRAVLSPAWANTFVPDCFSMTGGEPGPDRLTRAVYAGTVTAEIGDSRKETTLFPIRVGMTACRPQTEGPGYGIPFQRREVPEDEEDSPGAGIRVNGDDDDHDGTEDRDDTTVSGENDLIEVVLDAFPPAPSGLKYVLKRSNGNLKVWTGPNKSSALLDGNGETNLTFDSTPMTVWVEACDAGVSDLLLEAQGASHVPICSDAIHCYPFSSIVIVLGGETQIPSDPATPGYGVYQEAIRLFERGYDVHMYDEDDVGYGGGGATYAEVVRAIQRRNVTQVAIFGYSHGGGSTFLLANLLNVNRGSIGSFTIPLTAYIDGVKDEFPADMNYERRRPPGSGHHINFYQEGSLADGWLDGGPIDPPGADLEINLDDPTPTETHVTIDDDAFVLSSIETRLIPRVTR
jgi:hypothetical protein